MFTPFFSLPYLKCLAIVPRLCTYRVCGLVGSDVRSGSRRVSGSRDMWRFLITSALCCLFCFPVASSQHVGGERLLPPGILPVRQSDPVPPTAHALQRHQWLRQSGRRGELRWVIARCLSPRGWRGHAEERSASLRIMTLYECTMCVVCALHVAKCGDGCPSVCTLESLVTPTNQLLLVVTFSSPPMFLASGILPKLRLNAPLRSRWNVI